MDPKTLAKYLDFANHHQNATHTDIEFLCQKVKEYGFNSAFMDPYYVPFAKKIMNGQGLVGTVMSFPLGQESFEEQIFSVTWAAKNGADEIDCCVNFGLFLEGKYDLLLGQMKNIVETAKNLKKTIIIKFINEVGLFTDDQIKKFAELTEKSGADFVKICSGMGPRGPTIRDVELVKSAVSKKMRVKVAGGISTYEKAMEFINAGVNRIGTSRAVEIVSNILT
jgi:deoxyribose-phosphate aldolase